MVLLPDRAEHILLSTIPDCIELLNGIDNVWGAAQDCTRSVRSLLGEIVVALRSNGTLIQVQHERSRSHCLLIGHWPSIHETTCSRLFPLSGRIYPIYLFVLQHTKEVRQIEAQPDVYSSAVRKRIVPNLLSTFGYVLHSLMFAL